MPIRRKNRKPLPKKSAARRGPVPMPGRRPRLKPVLRRPIKVFFFCGEGGNSSLFERVLWDYFQSKPPGFKFDLRSSGFSEFSPEEFCSRLRAADIVVPAYPVLFEAFKKRRPNLADKKYLAIKKWWDREAKEKVVLDERDIEELHRIHRQPGEENRIVRRIANKITGHVRKKYRLGWKASPQKKA